MKNNSIVKNYIFNLLNQILTLIVPLIVTPYISRIFLSDGIGKYSYSYSIVNYFLILSILGIHTHGNKMIGTYQDDIEERSKKFWELIILKIFFGCISLISYFTLVNIVFKNETIFYLQGIYIVSYIFDITWFFQGVGDFKKITIRNIIFKIISVISILLFIKEKDDLFLYVVILSVTACVSSISMIPCLYKNIKYVSIRKLKPFSNIKNIILLFVPTVSTNIFAIIDKTMIGKFDASMVECGYYESAEKIIFMSITLITSLSTVVLGKNAYNYHKNNIEEFKKNVIKSIQYLWFLTIPMCLGIIGISNFFVPIFFGESFAKTALLLKILAILMVLLSYNNILGNQLLIAGQKQKQYTIYILIGGIFNIILNMILIPRLLSIGASCASVIGEFVISILCTAYVIKNTEISFNDIYKYIKNNIIAALIMFLIIVITEKIIVIDSFLKLFLIIFLAILIYIISLIILKDEFIYEVKNVCFSVIKRRKKI